MATATVSPPPDAQRRPLRRYQRADADHVIIWGGELTLPEESGAWAAATWKSATRCATADPHQPDPGACPAGTCDPQVLALTRCSDRWPTMAAPPRPSCPAAAAPPSTLAPATTAPPATSATSDARRAPAATSARWKWCPAEDRLFANGSNALSGQRRRGRRDGHPGSCPCGAPGAAASGPVQTSRKIRSSLAVNRIASWSSRRPDEDIQEGTRAPSTQDAVVAAAGHIQVAIAQARARASPGRRHRRREAWRATPSAGSAAPVAAASAR